MKLKNDFFTVIEKKLSKEGTAYVVGLNPRHFIYKAHFPDMPVTPGVCILQMALEILEDYYSERLCLKGVKNVKFLSVVQPDENHHVEFLIQKSDVGKPDGYFRSMVVVKDGETVMAKLSLICAENNG